MPPLGRRLPRSCPPRLPGGVWGELYDAVTSFQRERQRDVITVKQTHPHSIVRGVGLGFLLYLADLIICLEDDFLYARATASEEADACAL